jgi:hypothetical protein
VNSFRPRNPSGRFTFNGKRPVCRELTIPATRLPSSCSGFHRAEQSIVVHPSYFRSEQYQLTASDEYQMTPNFNATISLGFRSTLRDGTSTTGSRRDLI